MALLALAGGAAAQQPPADAPPAELGSLSLEQLLEVEVSTASRHGETLGEAPAVVTVVTAADIRVHAYRTLADILRSVPGFYVSDDRNYSYVGVRGFGRPGDYNTRILLLLDGLRVNDTIYDMGFMGSEFLVDVDLVERVEIVHGPGAALYGNNAFFAVVNVITRKGADVGGGELSLAGASWRTVSGRATYGRRTAGGIDYLLSASGLESAGQRLYFRAFDTPATNHGLAEGADGEGAQHFLASVSKAGLSLQASHSARDKGIPTASFGTAFNDPRSRTWDGNSSVRLSYERDWGAGAQAMGRVHYGRYHYRGRYAFAPEDGGLYEDFSLGEWWGAEAYLTRLISGRHRLGLGAELQRRFR
ncbi:MAG TPA: TonB-dependent receptor plug domain-containing protein, partial [Vicinamibacteria bacterium]